MLYNPHFLPCKHCILSARSQNPARRWTAETTVPMTQAASDWTLSAHPTIPKGLPVCIAIIDGYGENEFKDEYNAVHSAQTPVFDQLRASTNRFRCVAARGQAVGLPSADDMGNSEVGHNALGAGKIYNQGAKLVDKNLESGQLFRDEGWAYIKSAFAEKALHFIGLLSSGGVHSRYDQLIALVKQAAADGARKIYLHVLTDGRDVPDGTGGEYIETLEKDLRALEASHPGGDFKIASGGGRMQVTMDRYEADWPMVERGWKAHVLGEAPTKSGTALEAYTALKAGGVSDQNIGPFVVVDAEGAPVGTIQDGDAVVISNFRSDRSTPSTLEIATRLSASIAIDASVPAAFVASSDSPTSRSLPTSMGSSDRSGDIAVLSICPMKPSDSPQKGHVRWTMVARTMQGSSKEQKLARRV